MYVYCPQFCLLSRHQHPDEVHEGYGHLENTNLVLLFSDVLELPPGTG